MTVRDFGWMAAAYEPHWHRIIGITGSGSAIGECGHFVRGPVHRRLDAPRDLRELCATCLNLGSHPAEQTAGSAPTWPT
ncbi:hypothetical protein OOZ19_27740 [Saccharopolyspora sp. NFXS83]|uniref:hypothetical protein n=1 Tax=Saccharopolyspora sp. NFXS83 TaxID=2993560 RepID=UPI00224B0CB5|nr:hypothetical protein [Saccharopolyspora sp. NFXS83]MCX2734053.1 hypothetical protein [Saccharopolyspora sp. NFXS83]